MALIAFLESYRQTSRCSPAHPTGMHPARAFDLAIR